VLTLHRFAIGSLVLDAGLGFGQNMMINSDELHALMSKSK
jgi:16S rRNA U516 pseudouridylate synthase RsuA-like enzyme